MNEFDWNTLKRFRIAVQAEHIDTAINSLGLGKTSVYKIFSDLQILFNEPVIKKHNHGKIEPTELGKRLLDAVDGQINTLEALKNNDFLSTNEIAISLSAGVAATHIMFYIEQLKRKLSINTITLKTNVFNIEEALLQSDLFIFSKLINNNNAIKSHKLGKMQYGLFTSNDSFEEVNKKIEENKTIGLIGLKKQNIGLNEVDDFSVNWIIKNTKNMPNLVINTNSAINEFIGCKLGLGVACLYTKSPLINEFKLKQITSECLDVDLFAYYKNMNESKVINIISALQNTFMQ